MKIDYSDALFTSLFLSKGDSKEVVGIDNHAAELNEDNSVVKMD